MPMPTRSLYIHQITDAYQDVSEMNSIESYTELTLFRPDMAAYSIVRVVLWAK